jgi:hypothetical protein
MIKVVFKSIQVPIKMTYIQIFRVKKLLTVFFYLFRFEGPTGDVPSLFDQSVIRTL